MATVFELVGKIGLEGIEGVGRELDGLKGKLGGIGSMFETQISAAAIAAAGAVVKFSLDAAASAAQFGDTMSEMSQRTGIGTMALQQFSFAASQTGATLGSVETAMKRLQNAIGEASAGSAAAQDTFRQLGVSYQELAALSPEDQFYMIASAMAGITDQAQRVSLAIALFGRSGTEILPLINDLDLLNAKFAAMHLGISDAEIEKLGIMQDKIDAVGSSWDTLRNKFGAGIMLNVEPAIDALQSVLNMLNEVSASRWSEAWQNVIGSAIPPIAFMGQLGNIPHFAEGGIINKPTIGMIGESGAEAVIPLSNISSGGSNITLNVGTMMGNEQDAREMARQILGIIRQENRTRTYGRFA